MDRKAYFVAGVLKGRNIFFFGIGRKIKNNVGMIHEFIL